MGEIFLELVVSFWQRKTILSHFVFFFKIVKILQLCGRKQIAKIRKFPYLCDCLVCVLFFYLFFAYLKSRNSCIFPTCYTLLVMIGILFGFLPFILPIKKKGLRWKKRMEARIVILSWKALLQPSMVGIKSNKQCSNELYL